MWPPGENLEQIDGLYHRREIPIDIEHAQEQLLTTPAQAELRTYQYWVDKGWKTKHGSADSVKRLDVKLVEEYQELQEVLESLGHMASEDIETSQEHIVSELGDVLWVTTALANNSRAVIDHGMKEMAFDYTTGVRHINEVRLQPEKPVWYDTVSAAAVEFDELTIGDVDTMIESGFEPLPSTMRNVFDIDEDDEDIEGHATSPLLEIAVILNLCRRQYSVELEEEESEYMTESASAEISKEVSRHVAQVYFQVAFLASRLCSAGLADAVQENVRKVSGRIQAGLIDKSDGERTEDLL